jgi:hypothetical protein
MIQTLINCLSNDECDYQNALIPKTATAALANMSHVTQVESLINDKTIKRLFELMKMWGSTRIDSLVSDCDALFHVWFCSDDEVSLISVLKLCCNYSIAVECKDPVCIFVLVFTSIDKYLLNAVVFQLIVADVSTFASDIVTIVTTQPPAPLQSGSPSTSPAPSMSPAPSPSFDESSMTGGVICIISTVCCCFVMGFLCLLSSFGFSNGFDRRWYE